MSPTNDNSELLQALEMVLENKRDKEALERTEAKAKILAEMILDQVTVIKSLESKMTALEKAFLSNVKTYSLVDNGGCSVAIKCLKCGFTSHNNHDIDNLYCGKCKQFHLKA